MGRVEGKIAVITGSASGIGAATARLLAREGAKVVVADKCDAAQAEEVVNPIRAGGGEAILVQADVSQEVDCKRIMDTTVEAFGRLDVLVNNAGARSSTPTLDLTEEEFERVMGTNVKGVFFCCKYAIPYMKRAGGGAIVTVSSRAAFISTNAVPVYCASKGAALSWTNAIAVEHAQDGIRANTILPSNIRTPMSEKFIATCADPEARAAWFEKSQPLGRAGTPEDCANAILFLVSDDASFITNTPLLVDGGFFFS